SVDGHLYPVLVFIHGGGYQTGTTREIPEEAMAKKYAKNNIVFVAFQYRIGQLGRKIFFLIFKRNFPKGFASTGDENFAGNYGLWDQLRALQFVRDNIERFGGDPQRITISGFSAGAASVSALSISPLSNNLFQQTIQMSGTFFSEWAVSNRVVFETEKMAKFAGCDDTLDDSKELKKCLKGKTVEELMDAVERMGSARMEPNSLLFTPRIDADFFPKDVKTLLQNAPTKRNLIGVADTEALTFILLLDKENSMDGGMSVKPEEIENYDRKKFENFVRNIIAPKNLFVNENEGKVVQQKIIDFYLSDSGKIDGKDKKLTTDFMFIVPMLQEVHYKFEKGWPVFMYMIDYYNKKYYPKNIPIKGSYHCVELPPLFNITACPFLIEDFSEEDLEFEKVLLTSVVNFVTTGNPSISTLKWHNLNTKNPLQFARLNPTNPKMESALYPEKLKFWQKLTENYSFDLIRGINKETLKSKDEL
uniref:Carboxylic ester hydrolase n=1 Tax=Meloidogyne floridensis TaxID=298350 RepID=A0A915P573_9BILA